MEIADAREIADNFETGRYGVFSREKHKVGGKEVPVLCQGRVIDVIEPAEGGGSDDWFYPEMVVSVVWENGAYALYGDSELFEGQRLEDLRLLRPKRGETENTRRVPLIELNDNSYPLPNWEYKGHPCLDEVEGLEEVLIEIDSSKI
jgi:hypothetical protein